MNGWSIFVVALAAMVGVATPARAAESKAGASASDWKAVEQALGKSGQMMPGNVFRVAIPRTDLQVTVEGVPVKAGFALGSYAAFKATGAHAMVMGDLVLLDEEVQDVMAGLLQQGLAVTALHNHALADTPRLFYMHFWANDDAVKLARGLRAALDRTNSKKEGKP